MNDLRRYLFWCVSFTLPYYFSGSRCLRVSFLLNWELNYWIFSWWLNRWDLFENRCLVFLLVLFLAQNVDTWNDFKSWIHILIFLKIFFLFAVYDTSFIIGFFLNSIKFLFCYRHFSTNRLIKLQRFIHFRNFRSIYFNSWSIIIYWWSIWLAFYDFFIFVKI